MTEKMKRKIRNILLCLPVLLLVSCSSVRHPYTQEYHAGQGSIKGNVDTDDFLRRDKRFEIGADKDGNAVFKDPANAYKALLENYVEGLDLIQSEMKLEPVSQNNYQDYETFGWQVTSGTEAAREQAQFVSRFFDIYENSFD